MRTKRLLLWIAAPMLAITLIVPPVLTVVLPFVSVLGEREPLSLAVLASSSALLTLLLVLGLAFGLVFVGLAIIVWLVSLIVTVARSEPFTRPSARTMELDPLPLGTPSTFRDRVREWVPSEQKAARFKGVMVGLVAALAVVSGLVETGWVGLFTAFLATLIFWWGIEAWGWLFTATMSHGFDPGFRATRAERHQRAAGDDSRDLITPIASATSDRTTLRGRIVECGTPTVGPLSGEEVVATRIRGRAGSHAIDEGFASSFVLVVGDDRHVVEIGDDVLVALPVGMTGAAIAPALLRERGLPEEGGRCAEGVLRVGDEVVVVGDASESLADEGYRGGRVRILRAEKGPIVLRPAS